MSLDPSLAQRLAALRDDGLSPDAAAAAVMGAAPGMSRMAAGTTGTVAPDDLSAALSTTFAAAGLTAAALAAILHACYPQLSVVGVAQAVIVGLPDTTPATMTAALTGCGFTAAEAQGAVNVVYPATVTVQSTQPWQPTGVTVTGTQSTAIACSGSWTANPATGWCGPDGNAQYPAPQGYPVAGAGEGAVVGRVGSNPPFLVGAAGTAPAGQSGMLFLCIDDDLDGQFGAGLSDNSGTMTAVVTTTVPG